MAVVTKEGLQKLQDELDDLQVNQRAEVVREIEIAKGFGDLSENAEYSAAREKQRFASSLSRRSFLLGASTSLRTLSTSKRRWKLQSS